MRVLIQADGSCPSCGARGEISLRSWQGKWVHTLIPRVSERKTSEYACLYLRPFGRTFRAGARMRAVARAMRPFGVTVALHASEARVQVRRANLDFFDRSSRSSYGFNVIMWLMILWNAWLWVAEVSKGWYLRWCGIILVDAPGDAWPSTFRRLAAHSSVIVMDVSAATAGLAYEAQFIADLSLTDRLIFLLNRSSSLDNVPAIPQVQELYSTGLTIPVVRYRIGWLHRLTRELRVMVQHRSMDRGVA